MKKALLTVLISAVLAGCSAQAADETANSNKAPENNEAQQAAVKETKTANEAQEGTPDVYVPNPQLTDDRTLQKAGQTHTDDKGTSLLKAIKNVDETYQVGDLQLTIRDIKVIDHTPAYGMIDFFHSLTHDEQFDFIKINVEIKNTSNEIVQFAPIALLELSTGEKKDFEQDIYLEDLNGVLEGGETKTGNLGFILEKPLEENLKWVKITTSDVLDYNQEMANKAQEIKIEF